MKGALNGHLSQWINGWTLSLILNECQNFRKFTGNYDWSELEFPVSIKDIGKFENKNNISVNVLGLEGKDIYIHRNSNYKSDRDLQGSWSHSTIHREINLLMRMGPITIWRLRV